MAIICCKSKHTSQILAPVEPGLPIVCIGLNYANHTAEAKVLELLSEETTES